jgi:hypothetical protein
MQVREKSAMNAVDVYGVYWAEYQGKIQRFHLVIPEKGYPGFLSLPEAECELVDSNVTGFVLVKNARGSDTLIHPVLQEEALLDRLIDHDADAMEYFLTQLTM